MNVKFDKNQPIKKIYEQREYVEYLESALNSYMVLVGEKDKQIEKLEDEYNELEISNEGLNDELTDYKRDLDEKEDQLEEAEEQLKEYDKLDDTLFLPTDNLADFLKAKFVKSIFNQYTENELRELLKKEPEFIEGDYF